VENFGPQKTRIIGLPGNEDKLSSLPGSPNDRLSCFDTIRRDGQKDRGTDGQPIAIMCAV